MVDLDKSVDAANSPPIRPSINIDDDAVTTASSPISCLFGRSEPALSPKSIPPEIRKVEYAVRGRVAQRSSELSTRLDGKPFDEIVPCHIGNPMALKQKPLTYIRECVSLCAYPDLLEKDDSQLSQLYNAASIQRARRYMKSLESPGAYTASQGCEGLRDVIARFLECRDGFPTHRSQIYITNGASDGIDTLLTCILSGPEHGIMIPIPQYPLYTATIAKLGGTTVPYYLSEEKGWSFSYDHLVERYEENVKGGLDIKAIVVICPGNPCPTMLTREQVKEILTFAEERNMCVLADEVYQENAYDPSKPHFPFRKVLKEEGLHTQLISFHSSSKGYYGECGFRGGFFQTENVPAESSAVIYKMRSVCLCSNTMGQIVMACVCDPPQPRDADYKQYLEEKNLVLSELREKAKLMCDFFNSLPGVSCQPICGALYAFPNIAFPNKAFEVAEKQGVSVELMYALDLLEETGIVVTNGDGFGQQEGTHHIRTTILPPLSKLPACFERYRKFHLKFLDKYR